MATYRSGRVVQVSTDGTAGVVRDFTGKEHPFVPRAESKAKEHEIVLFKLDDQGIVPFATEV